MEVRALAKQLGLKLEGDGAHEVTGVAPLAEGGARHLGFVRDGAWGEALRASKIGAVIAPPDVDAGGARAVLRSAQPSRDFARACALLQPPPRMPAGIHPRAFVEESARVHESAAVGALASVGAGARIGARVQIHPNVAIGAGVIVGADCIVHSGCVIGAGCELHNRVVLQPGAVIGGDGFGYEFNQQGALEKAPQCGTVIIEDDVEIGAGATVDRARLGATRVGRGTKIDNLVMVAHNVQIGEHSVLVAQTGIAGSTNVGARALFMAQSGAAGHLQIGEGVFVGARGGVIEDAPSGARLWGFPALPERAWHRAMALLPRLGEILRRLRRVEKQQAQNSR